MKKFMIYFLMAFLAIGTCQARSEVVTGNLANAKALTYAYSPTISQCLTSSPAHPFAAPLPVTDAWSDVEVGIAVVDIDRPQTEVQLLENTRVRLCLYVDDDDDLIDHSRTKWAKMKDTDADWTELAMDGKDTILTETDAGTMLYRVTVYNSDGSLSKTSQLTINYLDAQHYPGFSVMAKTVAIDPNKPNSPFTSIVAQDVCGTGVFGLQLTTQNDDYRAVDTLLFQFFDQDGKLLESKKRDPIDASSSDNRGMGFIVDATPYVDAMKAAHITSKEISFYGTITTIKPHDATPEHQLDFTPVIYSQPVSVTFHTAPEVDTYVASNKQSVCVGDELTINAKIVENTGLDNVVNMFDWEIKGSDEAGAWSNIPDAAGHDQVVGNTEKQLYTTTSTPNYDTIRAYVEVYQNNFLKSQGCYAADTIDVVVYDNPVIYVEAAPDTLCVSDTLRAMAGPRSVDHRLTGIKMNYTWFSCDDAQGTNPVQVQTGSVYGNSEFKAAMETEPGTYYYMVEAKYDSTNIPACETEATILKVVVIAPPVFTFVNTDTLCYGGTAELSAEATIEFKNGSMAYIWESLANDKETVTDTLEYKYLHPENNEVVTGILEADTFFRVTAQFMFGGQEPLKGCVVDSTILVKVYPDPEITFFPEDFTMCKGGDSTLLVRATNNAEPISDLSYEWQLNRSQVSTDSVWHFITDENTRPGVYEVTVMVKNEHVSCVAYDTMYVSIIEPLKIEVAEADSICYGGTALVKAPEMLNIDSCADMNFRFFWSEGEGASHTIWTAKDTNAMDCASISSDRTYEGTNVPDLTVVNKDFDSLETHTARFYFNVISDMPGCSVKDSTLINLFPDPVIENVPDSTFVCEGNPSLQVYPRVTTTMPYTRDVNYKYILVEAPANFKATLPDTIAKGTQTYANPLNVDDVFTSYDTIVPGTYNFELVVEDAEELGCDVRDTFTVVVVKDPEIIVPNDTLLCEDGSVKLEFTVINHAMEYVSQNPNLQELNYNFHLVDADNPDTYYPGSGALNKDTNKVEVTISKEIVSALHPSVNPYRLVLTVSNNGSCSGCDCDAVSDSVKILVDAKPNTDLEYTSIEVCPGAEVVFAGAAFEDEYLTEENPFRYFWKALNANDTVTFASTPDVKKAVTDTLDIDYTKPVATNIYGIDTVIFSGLETIGAHQFVLTTFSDFSGCEKTDTFTVYVTEEKIHIASNNDTICQRNGDDVELVATVKFDIPAYTYDYQWTYGEGSNVVVIKEEKDLPVAAEQTLTLSQATITSDVPEIKHFFDSLKEGTHYITLNVHQDTTNCEMSFTDTVVVYPNPEINIDTNYLKPCPGYNTQLTILDESYNAEFIYYWFSVDSTTRDTIDRKQMDANAFPILTTLPFRENEVRVFYIRALNPATGCYSEDSLVVPVAKNPIEQLFAIPSATDVCAGTPVYLDGVVKPEEKPDVQIYEWFKCSAVETAPGSGIYACPDFEDVEDLCAHYSDALDTLDTFEEAFNEGGVYCFHLLANTKGYNCPIHATTPLITVHPNINVELTADHDTICSGGSVVVTATVTNAAAYFKHAKSDEKVFYYRIYENGMPISEEMSTLPGDTAMSFITHPSLHESENNATAYEYQIRVSGFSFACCGCDTSGCYSMEPGVHVTVLPDPIAVINGPTVLPYGYTDSILVCNVSHGYGEVAEIQWYKENVLIEGATGDTLRLPADLAYGDHHYYADVKQTGCGCQVLTPEFVLHVMDTIILDVDVNGYDCAQKTASITVTPVGDASAVNRYHWTLDGEELAEATNVIYNAAPGKYTVEALMAGGVVAATAEVELPDYGTLQVAITPASPQNVALNGESTSVTYTAQVAGGSGTYTYQWYMSGENGTEQPIAGANAETYSTPANMAAGHYYYFVEATDSVSGCSERSGIVQAIVANDIIVRIEGIESACEGSIVTLTAVVEGDQIGHKYQWKYFGDYIVGATDPQYVINTDSIGAGNHEFYVEITRDGCESVLSPVFYFNVIETPVVLAKGDTNLCPGATTTFVAETFSSMIEQPYKWIWFTSDSDTVAVTYENYYAFDEAGKYFVQSVFATSICSAVSDTFEIVPARELQEIEIKEANDLYVMCDGGQVNFTINDPNLATAEDSTYFGTPYYQWYVNGKKIYGADKNYYSSSPLTADYDVTNYLYSVEVTYSNYTCAVATDTFNVQVVANPTVVISGDPIICAGNNIHLVANANDTITGDTLAVQYEWRLNNVTIADVTGNELDSAFEASVDPYTFTVVVTRNAGCRTESAPFQVLVNDAPVVNITATDTVICEGGEATFTANLNDYNADNLMYQWTMVLDGDTTEIAGATKEAYTAKNLTAGEYDFIVAVSQKTSDCVVGDTFKLNVIADPVIDSISVSDTMICEGAPIVVTAFVTKNDSVNGAATYTWYKNGTLMEGIVDSTFTDYPTVTDGDQAEFVYSAVVTLAGTGCEAKAAYSKTVVVRANPTVVISGDPIICNGNNVHLVANVNDTLTDAAEITYEWRLDNVKIAEGKELDTLMNDSIDPYTFTVVVNRNNGCEAVSAPFQVLVNAAPIVTVTATDTAICEGGDVTFTANLADYNVDNLMYQWAVVDGDTTEIAGATQATYTAKNLTAGNYEYIVTVGQKTSDCEATGSSKLTVVADPVIDSISVSDTMICEGAPIVVTAFVTKNDSVNGAATYTWYKNGALMEGVVDSTFTDYLTVTDGDQAEFVYSAVVTLAGTGCDAKMAYSKTVVVNANPTVVISGDPIICNGTNVHLVANVNDTLTDAAEITYEWRLDNVKIAEGKELDTLMNDSIDPYTFTVVVNRNNGCEAVSAPFQVLVNAAPIVTVTSTDTAICEGGEATFTANLADYNADNLMYQWTKVVDGDTTEIAGATQATYIAKNLTAGEYEFIVSVGQKTSDCVAGDTIKLTVVADPKIDSITFSQTEICEGGAVEIEAVDSLAFEGNAVYTWYRNGQVLEGINGKKFVEYALTTDGDSTVYTYAVKVTQPVSGCESEVYTAEQTVTVYANPTVDVEVAGSPVVCEGGQVTLTANVVGGTADTQYQWYKDNVAIEGETNNTLTIADLTARETSYNFFVEIKQGATGCNNKSNVVEVTVVKAPVVTIASNYDAICEGGTATLTATIEGGVAGVNGLGTYNYYWKQNGETVAEGQDTYTLPADLTAGDYAYQLTVEPADSAYNCGATSNVANVQVVADPEVTIKVAETYDADVCEGGKTFLVSEVTGGIGENSYQWYRNGIILAGETNPTLVTDPELAAGTYEYTLYVTQTGVECAAWSNELEANVLEVPDVTIEGAENVCVGGTVTLTAEVTPADDTYTEYQWYRNGTAIYGANTPSYVTSNALNAGDYTYSVTIKNLVSGCVAQSASVDANVVADPKVVIKGAQDVCEGGSVVLTAEVIGGVEGAAYEYAWYLNGEQIAGANQSTYTTPTSLAATNTADHYYYTVEITPVVDGATNHGCNAISESVIADVIEGPVAAITGNGTICEGGSVTLVANVATPGTYYYKWFLNGEEIAGATNATYTTPNTLTEGTQQYSVEVAAGKSNSNCTYTATADVEVVADPVVTAEASIAEMCVGGKTVLTATVTGGMENTENVTYRWTRNGEVLPNVTGATFTDMLTVAGTYEYVVTVEQTESTILTGCAAQSEPITVEVANQPDVTIVWDGLLDVCEGGSIELTAQIEGGVGEYEYQWRRNNRILPDNGETLTTDNSLTYGEYIYTVTAVPTVESCKQTSDQVTTHVVTQPYWTSTVVRYPEMCEGEIIELVATVKGGVQDNNGNNGGFIIWKKFSDGAESGVAGELGGFSYDIAKEGTYFYYPTYNGPMGSNCVLEAPEGTKVEVHATPTAVAETAEGSDIICTYETAEIIVSFTGTAPFTFFVQDMNTNATTSYTTYENPYSIFVNPTKTTTYHIYSLGDAFCEAAPNAADSYVTVVVSDIEFDTNFVKVCPDESTIATFHVTAISGDPTTFSTTGLSDYGMNDYTDEPFDGSSINIDFAGAEPGDYEFTILIDECIYHVTVRVLMGAGTGGDGKIVEQRWDDVVVANNNPETNGGYRFVAYQWYKNGEPIPGATGQYYNEIGGLNGYYSLWAMTEDGKVYESCELAIATSARIKVYPTPARVDQEVTIELPLTEEELEGGVLDIYDDKGALVQHISVIEQVTKVRGFHAAGTYFGRVTTGTNEIKTVKFIIVH